MGYIGLPTACSFADQGLDVLGVDVDPRVLEMLRSGQIHTREPGLRELAEAGLRSGRLRISDSPEPADAFVIAVPTPAVFVTESDGEKRADLSHVVAACESIVPQLRSGNLVMLESTCPPGTTLRTAAPILERSGLRMGTDFMLAYTPERALPGRILEEIVHNDRVIGGAEPASAEAGKQLYSVFVRGEILLTDATTAEMVKLMENTYRDASIAVANEFSRLADHLGVDVWEAIAMANRHPRVNILHPGPGVGGHCISIDPWFLVESAPEMTQLIRTIRRVNDGQPAQAVRLIERALGGLEGRRIAGLGLAYKAGVDDLRESPALEVGRLLAQRGAVVHTFEPYAPSARAAGAHSAGSLEESLEGAEAVVLLVDHGEFRDLDPDEVARLMPGRVAVDLRGVWDRARWRAAGFDLHILGVGGDG